MTQRERLIVELLRNLGYAVNQSAGAKNAHASTGDRVALQQHEQSCRWMLHGQTCTCWIRSVTELQRCLRHMYGAERPLFRAVYERYVNCDRRPRTVIVKGRTTRVDGCDKPFEVLTLLPRGNGVTRALVETWRADIQPRNITAGVGWLASEFKGSPQLPTEWRIEEAA